MQALIVAAGRSSRLYPLTLKTPKTLLSVGEASLIERSVQALTAVGVDRLVVITGFEAEQIESALGDRASYVRNENFATTNNLASLLIGSQALDLSEPWLYLHADLIYHPRLLENTLKAPGEVVFLVDQQSIGEEEMKVRIKDGRIIEANKAIPLKEAAGEWTGIIKFNPEGAAWYLPAVEKAVATDPTKYDCVVVRDLAAAGYTISVASTEGLPWREVDFPEDLAAAREIAKEIPWPVPSLQFAN
ncbi:phosphocholine cytidylyltransferase family protein [Candidatus Berkelbacteria bacterium]|nr:phosphocholine cytidylyltransferase family protein [Candidatus Berkelbacteria bacterium]